MIVKEVEMTPQILCLTSIITRAMLRVSTNSGGIAPVSGVFYFGQNNFFPRLPVSARAGAVPLYRRQVSGFFISRGVSGATV